MKNEKKRILIEVVSIFITAFLTICLVGLGYQLKDHVSYAWLGFGISAGSVIVLMIANFIAEKIFWKKKNSIPFAGRIEILKELRNQGELDPALFIKKLHRLKMEIWVYVLFIWLLLLSVPFFAGATGGSATYGVVIVLLLCFYMIIVASLFIRLFRLGDKFDFSEHVLSEEYPYLHALAEKAANEAGLHQKIRIILLPGCNAGIQWIDGVLSLAIGTTLLSVLQEEEFYQVLLHEFSHVAAENRMPQFMAMPVIRFALWENDSNLPLDWAAKQLFLFQTELFTFEYELFHFSCNLFCERRADEIILRKGNPVAATAALAKTHMEQFFQHEYTDFVPESWYETETPRGDIEARNCEAFRNAILLRKDVWLALMEKELRPQFASHPIFRERKEALGNCAFSITLPELDTLYDGECGKAIKKMNLYHLNQISENYDTQRKYFYLESLELIEHYETSKESLSVEQIPQLIEAYYLAGRAAEVLPLCDKILMENRNENETVSALYHKGLQLLQRYDEAGIDLIYKAISINHNYLEEGLGKVGSFCCLMGLEEKREEYRAKTLELTQKDIDTYQFAETLTAADHLTEESFSQEKLNGILTFMVNAGNGQIKNIYLVRKVISESYFTSAFVVEFLPETSTEETEKTMRNIFHYLDNYPEDVQFSLFQYDVKTAKAVKKVKGACVYAKE